MPGRRTRAAGGATAEEPRRLDGGKKLEEESPMRENSGSGEGTNNLRDPTLRDHEREKGVSGAAIHGDRKKATAGKRGDADGKSP